MTAHRVLVLVSRSGNRRRLAEWLDERADYEPVGLDSGPDTVTEFDVDCAVVDGPAFDRYRDELRALTEGNESIFFPVLLVSDSESAWTLDHSLVDDVVTSPIRTEALRIRLDNLLERRAQSVELAETARHLRGFRAAVEQAGHSIMITDPEGTVQYVNPAFEETSGYSAAEILGRNPRLLKSGEHDESFYADLWETITAGDVWEGEIVNRDANGDQYVLDKTIAPLTDGSGEIERFVAVSTDVSERKAHERELEQYREYLRQTRDIVTVLEPDGTIRYESPAVERVLGRAPNALEGEQVFEYVHPDDRERVTAAFSRAVDRPDETVSVEYRFRNADGSWRWLQSQSSNQLENPWIEGIVVSSHDVTERKERERERRETKKTLESIIEASPDAIVMLDEDGRIILWNRAATELFGWTADEVVNETPPFLPGDDPSALETFMARLESGDRITGQERVRTTKSGEEIDVSLAAASVDVDGEVVGYMAVIEDVSERKAYERRIEEQRDTLELLNQVVRHDIRNDMQAVLGMVELLDGRVDDEAERYLDAIEESGRHAADLTITARDLTRTMLEDEMELEPVPLVPVVRGEVNDAAGSFDGATIRVDGGFPDVSVEANDLLGSVFRNLLKNGVQHHHGEDPTVTVSADRAGDCVLVRVSDNGPGVPDDHKEEIFGKGETGLDSEGTGVGLYLVRTLVEGYGGSVRVTDNDPEGSVFVVELPVADG